MKKKLVLDLDNTLCNQLEALVRRMNRDYNLNVSISDVASYSWFQEQVSPEIANYWDKPGIYKEISLYPEAQWFMECVQKLYDVYIISTAVEAVHEEKSKFIHSNFDIEKSHVIYAHKKWEHMDKDTVILDDYPVQIRNHVHHNGGYAILFNYNNIVPWAHYHPKGLRTEKHLFATSYYQVLQILKGL